MMERAVLNIVLFADSDVIATSIILPSIGTDTNESGIPIIWLTQNAVNSYNSIATKKGDLLLEDNKRGHYFDYYSYDGSCDSELYWLTKGSNVTPDLYNDFSADDMATYKLILRWLESNGEKF